MSAKAKLTTPKETKYKVTKVTKPKETKSKIGDKVKFFDEQNREFIGIIEKINPQNFATIRVSRIPGSSQIYSTVPKSSNTEIKPRYN